jgi:hypothetical protein
MPGARLREKLLGSSKLSIRGRRRTITDKTEALLLKQTPSQDPPDYASVESSPWGTFESHMEIHNNGSANSSNPEPLKGWTISTTTTTTTGPATSPPTATKMTVERTDDSAAPKVAASSSVNSCKASNRKLRFTKSVILRKSQPFKRLCHAAFSVIDCDKSGQVDKQELYTGLLLIHLRLAAFVGPAACRPVTKDQADTLFDLMDVDHSGTLSEKEFEEVMIVLCSSIVSRVLLLFSMTIFLIPILARNTVSLLLQLYAQESLNTFVTTSWNKLVNNPIFFQITSQNQNKLSHILYSTYTTCGNATYFVLTKIPRTVLDTMPFTLVSSILGSLLVPWCLLKIDSFFEIMARGSVDKKDKDE